MVQLDKKLDALKSRILVIEDDEAQLKTILDILESEDLNPIGCMTGKDALKENLKQKADVAIVDLRLPDMDGIEVLRGLKKQNPEIKVIVNTGFATIDSAVSAVNEEAFAFVRKMGDVEELLSHIRRAFHAHLVDYSEKLEREIRKRTADLEIANKKLKKEIAVRKQVEILQSDVRRILEFILRNSASQTEVFDTIIQVAEAHLPEVRATILLLDGQTLHHGAGPSMPDVYNALIDGLQIGPAVASCGTAMYRKAHVVVEDVSIDPLWVDYRYLGEEYGFRACWSQPILDASENVLGSFALYRKYPGSPNDAEIQLIESMAHLAGITIKRKQAEEELQESEERFRRLTNLSPAGIYLTDKKGNFLFVNPRWCEMAGLSQEEAAGRGWVQAIHPEDREGLVAEWYRNSESEDEWDMEYRLILPDEKCTWVHGIATALRDENGILTGYIGVNTDITERKLTEEALRNALAEVENLKNRLQEENIYLRDEIKVQHQFGNIIGLSGSLKKVLRQVEQVAATDSNVLILGETGTGKELIARGIHEMSFRKERTLVKVNCATLPASLIESELFGHEKGAFTGAIARRVGRFELAHEGTIFLDEIGDLPLDLQVKLLRVLQEREFERLGSDQTIKVDVQVIAATNRDIEKQVQEGSFREDLFFRLNVFPINLPPLRDRREDIPLLARHFIERHNAKLGKQIEIIPAKAMNTLQAYNWPGNIRELENIIERAMVISRGSKLELVDWFLVQKGETAESGSPQTLREMENQLILETLGRTMWRVSGRGGAAEILNMKPTTLEARMKKLGIKRSK